MIQLKGVTLNPNIPTSTGLTPLMISLFYGFDGCIRSLLQSSDTTIQMVKMTQ